MAKTLRQVQKQIKRKKGNKASSSSSPSGAATIHEKSRDAKRLQSAWSRDEKIAKLAASKAKADSHQLQRVAFFKECILHDRTKPSTIDDVHRLIELYLGRNNGEVAALKRERRAGRPPSPKEVCLEARRNAEESEYNTGLRLPDLLDEGTLKALKTWDGSRVSLNTIKFIRLSKDGSQTIAKLPQQG